MNNRTNEDGQAYDVTRPLPLKFHRAAWMEGQGLNCKIIGKALGVTGSRVSAMFSKGRATRAHIQSLRENFAMPEELLPRPSREKPGPLSAAEKARLGNQGAINV